jgi:hypothetical protein
MKDLISMRISVLSILLCTFTSLVPAQTEQDAMFALQRGYRTGYSDGYMAGYRDVIDTATSDHTRHPEYGKADRAYKKEYGAIEEYRDGYQQGFESGYATGYGRRSFESTLPADLKRRGVTARGDEIATTTTKDTATANDTTTTTARVEPIAYKADITNGPVIVIPADTEFILELQTDLSTKTSKEGERFTAKVIGPSEIAGATIEGRVSRVRSPGRIKRRSELQLSFDRIVLSDNRWSNFSGAMTEVMPVKGDNVARVDNEGAAIGQSSLKSDAVKVGVSTGVGTAVGAVTGGPVGAAIGAGVGAAFGVGAVVIDRGKHVRLNRNQQIRVKSSYETQIR